MLPLLVMGGISAGQSLMQFAQERAQAKANVKAAQAANLETWENTGRNIGNINLQRSLARRETAGELFSLRRGASEALGMVSLNSTAADTVGASTNAAKLDIARQLQEASAQVEQNYAITNLNLNNSLEDLMATAKANMRTAAKPQSWATGLTNALVSGASTAGGAYAQKQFSIS